MTTQQAHSRFIRTPLARAIQYGLLASCLAGGLPATVLAQQATTGQGAAAQQSYSIEAGRLDTALNRFAVGAGIEIAFDASLTSGKQTNGLQGQYSIDEGLQRLLAGTGLALVRRGDGSYRLEEGVADVALTTMQVQADRTHESAWGPVDGYIAVRSAAATKTDSPLMETAQSVSVVTREQIEDQSAKSVQQALRYIPGVFTGTRNGIGDRVDFINMRGFGGVGSIDNVYFDGLKMASDVSGYNSLQIDPYFLERIDVFKGPTSVLYGQSYPGGLVGLTSKRPLFSPSHEIQLETGSHNTRTARFDVSGTIGENQQVAYRLVGLASGSDSQFDHVENERYTIAPSLTFLPTDATSLTVMAYLQHEPNRGYYGWTPADGTVRDYNGKRSDNNFFDGEPDVNGFERYQRLIGYQLEHQFNDQWQARQNLRFTSSDIDYDSIYSSSYVGDSNLLDRRAARADESMHAYHVDNQLQGDVTTGSLEHTLLVGLDYQYQRNSGEWQFGAASPLDAFNPQYGNTQITYSTPTNFINKVEQTGVYLQDQISFNRWRLNLSGRQDWAGTSTAYTNLGMSSESDNEKFTSRASLLYPESVKLAPILSLST
ncbi:TonB-dependent siderophore receptor, partial [Halomonas sp. 3A7M]|uniref:TonB-dependent siderophore receptor n=1 Tax=Halomonas sp. 3A7M TaxID=2742616 RepID=UPI001867532C